MKNIETISYTTLNEIYPFHTYRSVVVTLETVENTFKFRIVGIDDAIDIMGIPFRLYCTSWIKKRYGRYLKIVNGFVLNIVRITIEEEYRKEEINYDVMG